MAWNDLSFPFTFLVLLLFLVLFLFLLLFRSVSVDIIRYRSICLFLRLLAASMPLPLQIFAAQTGESVNGFINRAIGEAMGESPQQPAGAPQGDGAILTPAALKTAQEAAQRAGETVPAFVGRAVETQAQRDKVMQAMRPKEKAPDKSET